MANSAGQILMPARRPPKRAEEGQLDLFGSTHPSNAAQRVDRLDWPPAPRFPVNRTSAKVRGQLWGDLVTSASPLLVMGYASISELVRLIFDWNKENSEGPLRVVFGSEPFARAHHILRSARAEFTEDVQQYWLDRGISLRQAVEVLHAVEAVRAGRVDARFVGGPAGGLHAKVYVGADAATVGSSNFTANGLGLQMEANARFERQDEGVRYRELSRLATNFWEVGEEWTAEFLGLLENLLQLVSWQEALARACADLLEGQWAARYLAGTSLGTRRLWPSQRAGIAQALWIIENVGSVLVADATGSGKTRMGAHLVRAVRDRLWSTGRVRSDLTTLVCPPAVKGTWEQEALDTGLSISAVSHGLLSRGLPDGTRREHTAVSRAQILAVDEAHNFLNAESSRSRRVRDSQADHVVLFTATPISRGAADLVALVGILGPDNFDEDTLKAVDLLERNRSGQDVLAPEERQRLRREIQRFTVRRTKSQINELVDREAAEYRHPVTGRICRYPDNQPDVYPTGETAEDEGVASSIREVCANLLGIAQLERHIFLPAMLRRWYTPESWLRFRTTSTRGLAAHHVLNALRSSRAALIEHVEGTGVAAERFGLGRFKQADTGDVLTKLRDLAQAGPPTVTLDCEVDPWLSDPTLWREACLAEHGRYADIARLARQLSSAREDTKVAVLVRLARTHPRLLAFDHHPVTLAVLHGRLQAAISDTEIIMATGSSAGQRAKVVKRFAPDAQGRAVALCSDAMNEGLNLQGASCIVHLDLPTTLRVAEQRVGRVDRMDSPHDTIAAWWPRDGEAFATRALETLVRRVSESESLLGGNLELPDFGEGSTIATSEIVSVDDQITKFEVAIATEYDGIQDALEPVRQLVTGEHALIDPAIYETYRKVHHRVVAPVACLTSPRPWAFFAVSAMAHGAPRWMFVETQEHGLKCVVDLTEVTGRLRTHLAQDPPPSVLDRYAAVQLTQLLAEAARSEWTLLPPRMLRALDQMGRALTTWARDAQLRSDETTAAELRRIARLAQNADEPIVDPFLVAERWLTLVGPILDARRAERHSKRYVLLRDIDTHLRSDALPHDKVVDAFSGLPQAKPLADRVTACILGVPERAAADIG